MRIWCDALKIAVTGILLATLASPAVGDPPQPAKIGDTCANTLGMTFAYIPTGNFGMGSPPAEGGRFPNELLHNVTISHAFLMETTDVTVGQFAAFVKDSGYQTQAEKQGWGLALNGSKLSKTNGATWQNPGFTQGQDHPVVEVSWKDAVAFNEWLSRKEGRRYRLPTEAEWEFACRAGTTTTFLWGDWKDSGNGWANGPDQSIKKALPTFRANTFNWDDGYPFTSPVGKFKANAWGLQDMVGNVWQWCNDYMGDYPQADQIDPQGVSAADAPIFPNVLPHYNGPSRVIRGGCFASLPRTLRPADRGQAAPDLTSCQFGFRCVMETGGAMVAASQAPPPPPPTPTAVTPTSPPTPVAVTPTPPPAPDDTLAVVPDEATTASTLKPQLLTNPGHSSIVDSVCFSADGKQVLTGSFDLTARLWDVDTGTELRSFAGHPKELNIAPRVTVQFSPDGKHVSTRLSKDNTTRLWDSATGRQVQSFGEADAPVSCFCFSADGEKALTGGADGTAKLWDAATGKQMQSFSGQTARVTALCFSHDTKEVVICRSDGTVGLCDIATGTQVRTFQNPPGSFPYVINFFSDGKQLVEIFRRTAAPVRGGLNMRGPSVIRWDAATGDVVGTFQLKHQGSISFSPDGKRGLTVCHDSRGSLDDNTVSLWDAQTGQEFKLLQGFPPDRPGNGDFIGSACYSPDANQVVTGSNIHAARLWDASTGEVIRAFNPANAYMPSTGAFSAVFPPTASAYSQGPGKIPLSCGMPLLASRFKPSPDTRPR